MTAPGERTAVAAAVCSFRDAAHLAAGKAETAERRARLWSALLRGPATTTDLRQGMGRYFIDIRMSCGQPGCVGHHPYWTGRVYYQTADLGNDLARLLRLGLVTKVKMPGWQRNLWAVRPGD